jgi:hypothetical protein
MTNPTQMKVPSSKPTSLRGKKLVFPSPSAADKVKVRRPLTRAVAKQEILVKYVAVGVSSQRKGKSTYVEDPIQIVDKTTPQENPTFKRLKRQLKEARVEVEKMKKKDLAFKKELNETLDMHHKTIYKANLLAKRFLPLHNSS